MVFNFVRKLEGFQLFDLGYDVWMVNARGNDYSEGHLKYSRDTPGEDRRKYWNFSWHEIGMRDLPASIDYILRHTNYPKLHYIGHSQGVTTFLVMASEKPEYNEKISLMVALAPPVYMGHNKNDIIKITISFLNSIEVSDICFNLIISKLLWICQFIYLDCCRTDWLLQIWS